MREPLIQVRLNTTMDVLIKGQDGSETRVAQIQDEGFRFLTAWEGAHGFEAPTIWPSNFAALAEVMPDLVRILSKATDDLLEVELKLNEAQKRAQRDINAFNRDS